jgi:hypothetical protein
VTAKTNREVVERYVNGMKARDLDVQAEVCAPDLIVEYPQSGERIRGWANVRAVLENYPRGLPEGKGKLIGSEDKWVVGSVVFAILPERNSMSTANCQV